MDIMVGLVEERMEESAAVVVLELRAACGWELVTSAPPPTRQV
jgi:hypothetical protein